MQRNIKNKITFFTFGLLAGVTLGVVFGVAIKALLGHLHDMNLGILNIGSKEQQISQRLDSLEGKISNQKTKTVVMVSNSNAGKPNNQLFGDNTTKPLNGDTARKPVDKNDSIALEKSMDDSTDVVVMTNQLVNVSNVSLVDLDSLKAKKQRAAEQSDSVIAAMNELNPLNPPTQYRIEFWQSPLNFKGYKMSYGKIILYGINAITPVKLVKLEDGYYLVANLMAYKLDYTDDMRPFDRVTDKSVLKKLSL